MKIHNRNTGPNIYKLSCVFITGYIICRIRYEPLGQS